MKIIKNFILRYKIPLATSGLCLIAALTSYIAEKYINSTYSIIALLITTMYCSIAFICLAFIWLHSSIKYTAWSILTGIIGVVAITPFFIKSLVMSPLSALGPLSLIPVMTLGYYLGSAAMVLLKASHHGFCKKYI